jgi:glycosyltransferase involved in cell wall biosynthesis
MAIWEFSNGLARRGHEVHVVHSTSLGEPVHSLQEITWFEFDPRLHHHFGDLETVAIEGSEFVACLFGTPPERLGLPLMWLQAVDVFAPILELSIFGASCPKLCTSSFLRDTAIERGVDPQRAVLLPYGIRHDKYRITRPIADRPPQVAMLYHPAPIKGGAYGIRALELAHEQVPELRAVLFGVEAPPPLPDWMRFVPDPPQAQLVDEIYNGSGIFVLSSVVEGFGLGAVEAMASGCALVASDCGGSRDYALQEETALVSPPGDPEAMAADLVRLLQDDPTRIELATRGAAYVRRFDWDRSAAQLEELMVGYAADPDPLRQAEQLVGWPA